MVTSDPSPNLSVNLNSNPETSVESSQDQGFVATVDRVVYRNPENNYTILRVIPRESKMAPKPVTVVGYLQNGKPGETFRIHGEWKEHPRFGHQYQAQRFEEIRPSTAGAIAQYLGGGALPGVGLKMAERIVAIFGETTLDVMDQDLAKLRQVAGIGAKKLQAISKVWESLRHGRASALFLQELGVTPGMSQRIQAHYGMETSSLIRENPYRLAEDIWGIGFVRADSIASNLGHAPDSHFRIRAGLGHVLKRATEDGHLFVSKVDLLQKAASLLNIDPSLIVFTLDDEERLQKLVNDEDRIYLPAMYLGETGLAGMLIRLKSFPKRPGAPIDTQRAIAEFESNKGIQYHPLQRQAIAQASNEKMLVITGGPGTGKTTTLLGILHCLRKAGRSVLLAAPTGRAAKRMEEITGIPAKTIHRLLEYQPTKGFNRNQDRPLECDAVVVDEISMVDLPLMYSLARAIPASTSLVLIGDEDQLPSVGPGQVLRDIIWSNAVPVVQLTEIFRQAQQSAIVRAAHAVRHGELPILQNDLTSDFHFMETNDPAGAADMIVALVAERLPRKTGLDPVRNVQVLTPMRRGLCGADYLNHLLQARFQNQPVRPYPAGPSRPMQGDKVMQIRNNYDKLVFNGDLGIVESVDHRAGVMRVRYENRAIDYLPKEQDEIVLAYATTIHKSQGNEYPAVVVPIMNQHYIMLYRNLFYTAITRAKKHLVLVGTTRAIAMAVKNVDPHKRNTYLGERLKHAS